MVFPYKISPKIYKIGHKEARMADYQPVALQTVFDVTAVVNLSYYRLPHDYAFSGEQHPFWEFLYVDRGSVVVMAGADRYQLHAGELAFHRPDEFHSFRAMGEANIFVVSFCCASPAMHRLEEKVLRLRFGLEDGRSRTLEEVGKEFNVTRERIRQIEAKALRKLRHPSRSKKLKDFLN